MVRAINWLMVGGALVRSNEVMVPGPLLRSSVASDLGTSIDGEVPHTMCLVWVKGVLLADV
jgi:hypothetical protein